MQRSNQIVAFSGTQAAAAALGAGQYVGTVMSPKGIRVFQGTGQAAAALGAGEYVGTVMRPAAKASAR